MTKEELFEIIESLMMEKINACYADWYAWRGSTPWDDSYECKHQQELYTELAELKKRFYAAQNKDTE